MSITIIVYGIWFLGATLMYAEYCYFWQLKWYRIDRFKDFLSTKQGRAVVNNRYMLTRTIVAIILLLITPLDAPVLHYSITAIFISDILYLIWRKYRGYYRRPVISFKALTIVGIALSAELILYLCTRDWGIVILVSALRLYVLSIVVIIINWTTDQIKRMYFRVAEKKLKKYPKLIKIGITGSYGKTSVKELLAQILSHSYKVAFTPKNTNSDIGISKFILATNFENIDVCIVEMGAYNKGDIKLVCDIVHPSIGILTAINQQHLSLFGSIENIQKTKYELVRSIPREGISILNADNPLCMQYAHELQSTVRTFGSEEETNPDCLVESARTHEGELSVRYKITSNGGADKIEVQPKVVGEHQAMNVAPCILVAKHLGMSKEQIISAINNLHQPDQSIKLVTFGKAIIIDDSYNSNPDGFKAALELLGTFPSNRRRVVLTRGMDELGSESAELHEKIGNEISFFADELVIITPNFADALKRGIITKYHTDKVQEIFDPEKIAAYIENIKNQEVVVLIENKIPPMVRDIYTKNNV